MKGLSILIYAVIVIELIGLSACLEQQQDLNGDSSADNVVEIEHPNSGSPFVSSHPASNPDIPSGENLSPTYHATIESALSRLQESPQDTTALIQLAHLTHDGHKLEDAVGYYRRYLELHPAGRKAWLDLTKCLGELERWDEALDSANRLFELAPNDPSALYNLGAIHANRGQFELARQVWESLASNSTDPEMARSAKKALTQLADMVQ